MYWVREIAGWALVLLGLGCFYLAYGFFQEPVGPAPQYFAGFATSLVGIIVFRGGIHLLKVAVAARVCLHANALVRDREPAAERAGSPPRQRGGPR